MKRIMFDLAIIMTAGFFIGLTLPLNNTVISLTAIVLTYVLGISIEDIVMKKDKEKDKEKSITQVMAEIKKARKKKKKHGTSNN
jgi:uncharacterized membrane-anchored protein YitT (DUF2179 family)